MNETPWTELGALIRSQRSAAGLTLRDLSERTSISNAYLSQIERGLHEPSLSVLRAVSDALRIPLASLLKRAGVLEGGSDAPEPSTESAIMLDPHLSEPQRVALLSVYRSFVPPRRRR